MDGERAPLLGSHASNSYMSDLNMNHHNTLNDRMIYRNEESIHEAKQPSHANLDNVPPVSMAWRHVNVHVNMTPKKKGCCGGVENGNLDIVNAKQILHNVNGHVPSGTLLAILGASGAGKSTLLNVLTHRNTKSYTISGEIYVNGFLVDNNINEMSAYVQQDDLFISTLTVREQLQFRALLRMDKRVGTRARLARVEDVIQEMGLSKCASNRIGNIGGTEKGLSGGERKRLSFASEALTNPPIFFCDEPTSGLDTFMARNIVSTLRKMAAKGRVILCTIHQPSSDIFAMFNQILLLAEGRTAFMGSQEKAMEFFGRLQFPCPPTYNPADHFILTLAVEPGREAECRTRTHHICDTFEESLEAKSISDQTEEMLNVDFERKIDPVVELALAGGSRYEASWFTQFRYLMWRAWVGMIRDVMLFRVRIFQILVMAIIVGLTYLRLGIEQKSVMSINGALFLMITNTSFSNLFAVVNSFPIELAVFFREYGTGLYRSDCYYLAKTIVEIPVFILITILFGTVTYWMIGLYESIDAFLIAVGVLLLTANVALSLGYLVSTLCGSVNIALAIAPPLLIPFMLFGGLFVNNDNIPVYFIWLKYLSWFKHANEILMVNQWQNVHNITCDGITNSTSSDVSDRCQYKDGNDVLYYTGFDKDNVLMDILLLVALQVGFRILSLIALVVRARRSKE
ncbi:ATP-binding cassette sub-family g member [Plakobranchus ocellatus]|uniref:ATP-binding cassette sub-family g member n=1 Tax=Plakobranchus ocellatus TaxID=259542 RepID=A0AAV4D9G2_9GAST|nr:ATP-binding cassette sub-family g member [Plakobranchus ocellatus]